MTNRSVSSSASFDPAKTENGLRDALWIDDGRIQRVDRPRDVGFVGHVCHRALLRDRGEVADGRLWRDGGWILSFHGGGQACLLQGNRTVGRLTCGRSLCYC